MERAPEGSLRFHAASGDGSALECHCIHEFDHFTMAASFDGSGVGVKQCGDSDNQL
jgi:hypothetical protein